MNTTGDFADTVEARYAGLTILVDYYAAILIMEGRIDQQRLPAGLNEYLKQEGLKLSRPWPMEQLLFPR